MSTSAPKHRSVCQLSGEVRQSGLWKALAEFDARQMREDAELEALREENARLRCRLQELGETA
ncbi:hypothetical protein SEA_GERALT_48 [Mycobacterium phage Geralt]|uniref:Helix-turn-helix DNA binding domain protein n=7 Tax=Cheoctovirus TaxID=1623281 RepID=A0A249XQ11_9CAUD|nr:gp47 [Mycobacterium phage Pacc40]YP_008410616.1 hypothetical protein N856_gp047 [Mycobacterium phage Daenerys]YP_009956719.1 hypothetical protein I5H34_gp051 [Mycobacterium phage Empress]YP_009958285.1 hypothetical protein I5H49_gp048 [Mycobacterium phage JoeyJr]YP_009961876.1 hypothetical protein I5H84_gp048 [Mycobacterium phage RitaG]YP_009962607.1 hypothetical protein I5H91_gp050 [Mycobacterium phage Spoonbill]YP_010092518.1 hypothetical protein KNT74_gp48 [Mycobacterium phage Geralt]Y